MKNLLIIFFVFSSYVAFSGESTKSFEALVRNDNKKPKIEKVSLEDLISQTSFDGKYFKIVKGKSDEAISFDSDRALLFRAATVYYHLTKARNYFVNTLKSSYVENLEKIIVRVELTNQFSELGHFAHDNYDPQFNNALTIPAGKGLSSRGVKPWGIEIWFRPSKKIHLRDLRTNDLAAQEIKSLISGFRNQTHMQSFQRFLLSTINAFIRPGAPSPLALDNVIRTAGSSLVMEAGYQFLDPISKAFTRKWYYLDTAIIPEIIYHEYTHAALSDSLKLTHSTAIIEGMADFFSGKIADNPKLAAKIKKYNTYNGKNAKKKADYMLQFEMTDYANTDFVFGLLWELDKVIGEDQGAAFMYELRKNLTTNSSIREDLIEGLLDSCQAFCENPFIDKLRFLKALNLRGL